MGEGFKQVKTKYMWVAAIISALLGLSFGGIALGAQLLLNKLVGMPFRWLYCILICLAFALVGGGVAFLLLYPRDKKLAKELDNVHGLNEKVQTALACKNEQGEVVEMLQSDTDARLHNLQKLTFGQWLKHNMNRIWACFVVVPLAVGITVGGLVAPSIITDPDDEQSNPSEDEPFAVTDEQLDAVQALIIDVNASELTDESKTLVVESLNRLFNNLLFAETYGEMTGYVNSTINSVERTIKQPLSYKALANALGSVAQNEIAKMIADGVQVYKNYTIVTYSDVEYFYIERTTAVEGVVQQQITEWLEALADSKDKVDDTEQDDEETTQQTISASIATALGLSQVNEKDGLRSILYEFARNVALSNNVVDNNSALKLEIGLTNELAEQTYLLAMNKYVTNSLRRTFDLDIPADEDFVPTYSEETNKNEGEGNTQGGYGKGDMLYGSDDLVYDPSTGEYVTYGELLNDYYAIVDALLRDGTLTEEQQAILRSYFEILFSGIAEE